jgi:TonB family protein
LQVSHLSPPRSFYVGEAGAAHEPASDFLLDTRALGVSRLPLVLEQAGRLHVVVPAGAEVAAEPACESELPAAPELAGARLHPLAPGARVRVSYLGLSFFVRYTEAAAPQPRLAPPRSLLRHNAWQLASLGLHGLLLGAFYCLPPTASALSLEQLNADDRFIQYHMLPPAAPELQPSWQRPAAQSGSEGQSAAGEAGALGDPEQPRSHGRLAVRSHADVPHLDRLPPESVQNAGILGILRSSAPAVSSLFARDNAEGRDAVDALGILTADPPGASFGPGGLAMIGTGHGGNGTATGTIGVGRMGTIGVDRGDGTWGGCGGCGGSWTTHVSRVPRVRPNPPEVFGSLSKETIRRVIGRHLNEVRYCYEQRLVSRPELQGRVAVKFMIDPTGAVRTSALLSSDVGDAQVGSCINDAVKRWVFPAPEGGGVVVVNYPFVLSQTGQ